jgi:hypothetical protein
LSWPFRLPLNDTLQLVTVIYPCIPTHTLDFFPIASRRKIWSFLDFEYSRTHTKIDSGATLSIDLHRLLLPPRF